MTELSTLNPTIMDIMKAEDPKGGIATVIEMLQQKNDVLDHATWLPCNDGTMHASSIRTGLPEPTWRKLYQFVQPGKSTRAQIKDATGILAAYAEVDKDLADKNGNAPAFRLSEDAAFIEGMNQEAASTFIYGNEGSTDSQFTGVAARLNSLSAANGGNIIDAGGTGDDLTSVYLCTWGPNTGHFIYPNGFPAGLQKVDKGVETATDGLGGLMEVYRTYYTWKLGFVMRDWRYFVRIANIDLSDLSKAPNGTLKTTAGTGADLLDLFTQALELLPDTSSGRTAFYCNRKVRSFLRRQTRFAVMNSTLSQETIAGKKYVVFDDVPIGRVDAIMSTEDRVV